MANKREWSLTILGLNPGATKTEVKEAYRDLVVVWHPDKFTGNERLRQKAESMLIQINEANAYLSGVGFDSEWHEREPQANPPEPRANREAWVKELGEFERLIRENRRTKSYLSWSLAIAACLALVAFYVYRQSTFDDFMASVSGPSLTPPSSEQTPRVASVTSSDEPTSLEPEKKDNSGTVDQGPPATDSAGGSAETPKPWRFGSTTEVARIYSTPSVDSTELYRVAPDTFLGLTGTSGDFYKISVKGQSAYVQKAQVKLVDRPRTNRISREVGGSPRQMEGAASNESKSWRGRVLTSPSGNVFRWTKDTPPTSQDFKMLMEQDKEMAATVGPLVEAFKKTNGRNLTDEERFQIQAQATQSKKSIDKPSLGANVRAEVKVAPDNSPPKVFYSLGSTEENVRFIQGTPTSVVGDAWKYDFSTVRFQNGKVVGYTNVNSNLKVRLRPASKLRASFFTLGSTPDTVVAVQGTPSSVTGSTWNFGLSSVRFSDGRVAGYSNTSQNLKVKVLPNSTALNSRFIGVGSTTDEVLLVQGTPTAIIGNLWSYDQSSVRFSEGAITGYSNVSGNLRIRQ